MLITYSLFFYGLLLVSARSDPLLHDCTHLAYKWGFITEFNSSKWLWGQRWLLLYGMVSSTECCDVLVRVGEFMVWASCGNTVFRRKMILCRAKQYSPHSALTVKYFGCISVPSFCHGYLSLYFGFLVPLSSSSALVPHLLSLTCWLIQVFWWHSKVGQIVAILVPTLAFKPCPWQQRQSRIVENELSGL